MPVTINTNVLSIKVRNILKSASFDMSKTMRRMASGVAILSTRDDAANYCIGEKLNVQLREFNVVSNNIQNGMSLINTADGAINNMSNILSRLRDLSLQGANGTYSFDEREALQNEANELTDELYRIKNASKFNDIELFGLETNPARSAAIKPKTKEELDEIYGEDWIEIASVEDLKQKIATGDDSAGKVYVLTADINLNNEEWTAIGTSSSRFKGTFDGNSYSISNLAINKTNSAYQGLFGYSDGATFTNVKLEGANIVARSYVGTLVGYATSTTIEKCSVENVTIAASKDSSNSTFAGGLTGVLNSDSTATNCYVSGSIEGGGSYTGGLFGATSRNSTISNSYSSVNVEGQGYTGGLTGIVHTDSTISNSYSTGTVTGTDRVGGLTGNMYTDSKILNSYSLANVSGDRYVGGLSGAMRDTSEILNSYSTGTVKGKESVGGIVGLISNASGSLPCTIANSISTSAVSRISGTNTSFGSLFGSKRTNMLTNESANNYTLTQNLGFTGTSQTDTTEVAQEHFDNSDNWKILGGGFDYSTIPPTIKESSIDSSEIKSIQICVGSNGANDMLTLDVGFNIGNLKIDLSNIKNSIKSVIKIDELLNTLTSKQAKLGATANRLESNLNVTETNKINWSSTISTIKDADIAKEASSYAQKTILQEVALSLLAQANQTPNIALSLV